MKNKKRRIKIFPIINLNAEFLSTHCMVVKRVKSTKSTAAYHKLEHRHDWKTQSCYTAKRKKDPILILSLKISIKFLSFLSHPDLSKYIPRLEIIYSVYHAIEVFYLAIAKYKHVNSQTHCFKVKMNKCITLLNIQRPQISSSKRRVKRKK